MNFFFLKTLLINAEWLRLVFFSFVLFLNKQILKQRVIVENKFGGRTNGYLDQQPTLLTPRHPPGHFRSANVAHLDVKLPRKNQWWVLEINGLGHEFSISALAAVLY